MNALFSLWFKDGLIDVARDLSALDAGCHFYGSRGTAGQIGENGFPAKDVADIVGEPFPDNLVVTLSKIHFGILCDRSNKVHMDALEAAKLPYIDVVWVSLYPLKETIEAGGDEAAVRKANDMGGVALLRSGAKGRRLVASSLADMRTILKWFRAGKPKEEGFRDWLAWRADALCAAYCKLSADYNSALAVKKDGYRAIPLMPASQTGAAPDWGIPS